MPDEAHNTSIEYLRRTYENAGRDFDRTLVGISSGATSRSP